MSARAPLRRPWRPSPAIVASAALHLGAGAAWLARPQTGPFALAALIGDHLLLAGAGLWPRSRLLGPNWTRLPAITAMQARIAITIDDGPDPQVTPRVLDLLDDAGAAATFFCIGRRVERHGALAREIVRRGHALENHGDRHGHAFSLLGPRAMHAEIARAQERIAAATGVAPVFFRAPAGLRNPFLEPVLARLGLRLASWSRRGFDTRRRDPEAVLRRLVRGLAGGEILLLHDGHAARTARGEPVVVEVLPRLCTALRDLGLGTVTLRQALAASECGTTADPG